METEADITPTAPANQKRKTAYPGGTQKTKSLPNVCRISKVGNGRVMKNQEKKRAEKKTAIFSFLQKPHDPNLFLPFMKFLGVAGLRFVFWCVPLVYPRNNRSSPLTDHPLHVRQMIYYFHLQFRYRAVWSSLCYRVGAVRSASISCRVGYAFDLYRYPSPHLISAAIGSTCR